MAKSGDQMGGMTIRLLRGWLFVCANVRSKTGGFEQFAYLQEWGWRRMDEKSQNWLWAFLSSSIPLVCLFLRIKSVFIMIARDFALLWLFFFCFVTNENGILSQTLVMLVVMIPKAVQNCRLDNALPWYGFSRVHLALTEPIVLFRQSLGHTFFSLLPYEQNIRICLISTRPY
jgi:hypothetical protein